MLKMKKYKIYLFFILLLAALLSCSNPFKSEKKKELVLEFINDYLPDTGRYIFFWNGRDDNNKYVEPGRYIVLLEIKSWQDQEYITALEGGKERANDQSRYEPGYWIDHDLETPFPDTFHVAAGVNIPILLASPARVKISIFRD